MHKNYAQQYNIHTGTGAGDGWSTDEAMPLV